jgi:hypothetical protein
VTVARLFLAAFMLAGLSAAQQHISFTTRDGWIIDADMYGAGDRGVVWCTEGALAEAEPWEIDRVVLLAHGVYSPPEKLKGRKLSIVSRGDRSGRAADERDSQIPFGPIGPLCARRLRSRRVA